MGSTDYPRTHVGVASSRIPLISRPFVSARALVTLDAVERFVEEECVPADAVLEHQIGIGKSVDERFSSHPAILEQLKSKARSLGLWNLFLPPGHDGSSKTDSIPTKDGYGGAGFTNLEYGLMAECLGKSRSASEAMNCSAPDTGNMEVFAKYGSADQKKRWLTPLLDGKIRSAFLMTEPAVASSDATNISMSIHQDAKTGEWVMNGEKWWSSGAGDPRCAVYLVMGRSGEPDEHKYRQQSVVVVPADTPGITVHRMLSVFGYDDAPHGHGHISFKDVRVPAKNIMLGPGRGFEIIQGRLGPGRIHHAMRCVGAAEKALDLFLARMFDPAKKPFGRQLGDHPLQLARLAECRLQIDAARLVVINAAAAIDALEAKGALREIAAAKILVPRALLSTLDHAIQAYGGAGVSQDTPLAAMWALGRTMRIVDGPDEVHLLQLARRETKRADKVIEYEKRQAAATKDALARAGLRHQDPLALKARSAL